MNILLFGQLAGTMGTRTLRIEAQPDTDKLVRHIELVYPALRGLEYHIAVNRDIIQSNTALTPDTEIALLPPYSGG